MTSPPPDAISGFNVLIGLEYVEASPDRCVATLEADERHLQPLGLVHGGVFCAMVEAVASMGAAMHGLAHGASGVVGVANSTDFYRSHRGGRIRAEATPVHRGRSQQVWQVVISRDDDGVLLARGQLRLHNLYGRGEAPPAPSQDDPRGGPVPSR